MFHIDQLMAISSHSLKDMTGLAPPMNVLSEDKSTI